MGKAPIRFAIVVMLVCSLFVTACASSAPASSSASSALGMSVATAHSSSSDTPASPDGTTPSNAESASSAPVATNAQNEASVFAISVGDTLFEARFADTAAAESLRELLQEAPISVSLHEYGGFEKVGPLPAALPADDMQLTTQPGDIMLYQGNQITVFYGSNSWSYTPLGAIDATQGELFEAFGSGDVEVTLSLA